MKTKSKSKIVVSVLALAMGAGLAGSISGSVAWYQYSTRVASLISGTSVGTRGRLQVKFASGTTAQQTYSERQQAGPSNFAPTTVKKNADDTLTFFDHPVYQVAQLPEIDSTGDKPYVDLTFNFRFQTNTTSDEESWEAPANDDRGIYLSHFDIVPVTNTNDVSDAVRVALLVGDTEEVNYVLAKSSTAKTTLTSGNLDLNGNGEHDTMDWSLQDYETPSTPLIVYSTDTEANDPSYDTNAHSDVVLSEDEISNHIYDLDDTASIYAKKVCTIDQALTIRVWLEGWEKFNSAETADWAASYIAQNFNIQLQFICQADR